MVGLDGLWFMASCLMSRFILWLATLLFFLKTCHNLSFKLWNTWQTDRVIWLKQFECATLLNPVSLKIFKCTNCTFCACIFRNLIGVQERSPWYWNSLRRISNRQVAMSWKQWSQLQLPIFIGLLFLNTPRHAYRFWCYVCMRGEQGCQKLK